VEWNKHHVGGVVVAPTRELANQISNVLVKFLAHVSTIKQLLFIGGTSVEEDLENFQSKGGNILIVTPGRFHDLLLRQEGSTLKSALKHLVHLTQLD
jgi:ATP-dependent RNA helicase DDX55/SPB4